MKHLLRLPQSAHRPHLVTYCGRRWPVSVASGRTCRVCAGARRRGRVRVRTKAPGGITLAEAERDMLLSYPAAPIIAAYEAAQPSPFLAYIQR